jgi:hypothetical protein
MTTPHRPRLKESPQRKPTEEATELAREAERLVVQFERNLRDLRVLRNRIIADRRDKGVLGSRGLTEFVVEYLKSRPNGGANIHELLVAAEQAGYAIPIARTLSKRLTLRAYTHGDIAWSKALDGWYWKGITA